MKKLNIFIDESGDFGINDNASDLYVVSFVFLSSLNNIEPFLNAFKERVNKLQFTKMIHTADLIRHKRDYKDLSIPQYISLYNKFSSHMDTNMSYGELLSLVSNININDLKSNYSELMKMAKNNG